MIKAVFFDFGGVITSSPFEAFKRYEQANNLPENFIIQINSTNPDTNAWALLERNEVDAKTFDQLFLKESSALGHSIPGATILQLLAGQLRQEMIAALKLCKQKYPIACLTNNAQVGEGPGMTFDAKHSEAIASVMELFDYVQESSKVGCRKPEPTFYQMACEAMNVVPSEVVFLDDLGINLKPARAMGMTTIKVTTAEQALQDLGQVLDLQLLTETNIDS